MPRRTLQPAPIGESWWTTQPRLGFTANAATRFDGCAWPSHKARKPVYESVEDAIAKRVPLRVESPIESEDES